MEFPNLAFSSAPFQQILFLSDTNRLAAFARLRYTDTHSSARTRSSVSFPSLLSALHPRLFSCTERSLRLAVVLVHSTLARTRFRLRKTGFAARGLFHPQSFAPHLTCAHPERGCSPSLLLFFCSSFVREARVPSSCSRFRCFLSCCFLLPDPQRSSLFAASTSLGTMPLPHPLVQLCGLLLAVAVTCASASAPVYGPGEVAVNVAQTPSLTTRASQYVRCSTIGGALLPTATDAVFELASQHVNAWRTTSAVGYMGGSTIQSSSDCTVYNPSVSCVWSWDEGRYAASGNALPFYKGNRDPIDLPSAAMIGTAVSNHWYVSTSGSPAFPGTRMQRYGVLLRGYWGTLNWADSSDSEWSYKTEVAADPYTFCAIEQTTTTSTTEPKSDKGNGLSAGAAAGIAIGVAAAVGLIIGLVLWLLLRSGRCCRAEPAATTARASSFPGTAEGLDACAECAAASRRGSMSRANSVRSYRGDFEDGGNRSFHGGTPNKDGGYRYGSFRGSMVEGEGGVWQDADGIMHVEGSQSMRAAPGPYAVSVPSRRGSMMMITPMPPQTMMTTRMPPQAMMQPQLAMCDNWRTWETPQTEDVSASGPEDQQVENDGPAESVSPSP